LHIGQFLLDELICGERTAELLAIQHILPRRMPATLGGAERANALVDALASLYAYVYDVTEEAVHRAAQQRALAMDISDGWIERGCDPASPLIADERAALVRSFAALLSAVHRP